MNQNVNLLDDIEPELIRLVNEGNSQQSTSHTVESNSSLVTDESLDRMSPDLWPELGMHYFYDCKLRPHFNTFIKSSGSMIFKITCSHTLNKSDKTSKTPC